MIKNNCFDDAVVSDIGMSSPSPMIEREACGVSVENSENTCGKAVESMRKNPANKIYKKSKLNF